MWASSGNMRMRRDLCAGSVWGGIGQVLRQAYADGIMSYEEARIINEKYGDGLDEKTVIDNSGIHCDLRTALNRDDLLQTTGQKIIQKLYSDMAK